ncbi:hypothetical protein [Caulobacter sp. UC70_42]|uniref:hypothetical protein n=1 Tax=Caulobacter sp. UC70_42 TaxID=3374551 RepID=UPI003757BEBE
MMSDKRLLNRLPKTIDQFARRKMRGSYDGERSASYVRLATDRTATVTPTVLVETADLIELLVVIEAANWSVTFVAKKAKLNGSRLWSATGADILAVSGVTLDNIEDVSTWLALP